MIAPGSANPLLMAGSDPLDNLGKIERSVRFRSAASAHLNKTLGSGNRKKWTWRACVKRGSLGSTNSLFSQGSGTYTNGYGWIYFNSSNQLDIGTSLDGTTATMLWNSGAQVFRDVGSHLDIVVVLDTTQVSSSDRLKVWANGVIVPGAFTTTTPSLDADLQFNRNSSHYIGANNFNGFDGYNEGYESSVCFVDGQALTPSAFGQFHPSTGQWRPKSKAAIRAAVSVGGGTRNGWGTNGFFLPFESADFSGVTVYDRSQSDIDTTGNNWTLNNISLTAGSTYDLMLDTPTNNFCTFNPLSVTASSGALSDGNLKSVTSATGGGNSYGSMAIPTTGVWQVEFTLATMNNPIVGLSSYNPAEIYLYNSTNAVQYYTSSAQKFVDGALSAYGVVCSANDVIGVVADAGANTVNFYRNGTPLGSINHLVAGLFPCFSDGSSTTADTAYLNAGQRPFSFPIAGAKALNTKNLPFPAIPKSESAFVARTDSGANIVATLAAAAPWSDWIRIYKRRDSAEGWRWQFSDDSGYYLDSASTSAKAAFPALSGTSYVGYALRVSAGNGIATGRLTHVNGAADTVADGLSNARKMIILVNEAGSNWFAYHPDLTAGKLFYLNLTNMETTDATINSVTASGFTVAAALPSGTYRWLSLSEFNGFLSLNKHIGNGSTDGVFVNCGLTPELSLIKRVTVDVGAPTVFDIARSPYNLADRSLDMDKAQAETVSSAYSVDLVSNGIKIRGSGAPINLSGSAYVSLQIAAFPFRYANAR